MKTAPLIGWIPSSSDLAVASTRLRCHLPIRYLRKAGWDCEIFQRKRAQDYGLVIFQKIYDEAAIGLALSLRSRGVPTVFDLCDNHFYNPTNTPDLAERAKRLQRMIEAVNLVSISTSELAHLVADRETVLIDDALDHFEKAGPSGSRTRLGGSASSELRLVWYGNAGSQTPSFGLGHIKKVIPLLEDLHSRTPLTLTVISNSREIFRKVLPRTAFPSRYHRWRSATFPRLFQENHVCLIPIEVNPFTVCKTSNRVALSLLLGVPVIADKIPSFQEFSQFIRLEDWKNNLHAYASDADLRESDADSGQQYVLTKFTPDRVVSQWTDLFSRVLG